MGEVPRGETALALWMGEGAGDPGPLDIGEAPLGDNIGGTPVGVGEYVPAKNMRR